jgi:hypothetical protein
MKLGPHFLCSCWAVNLTIPLLSSDGSINGLVYEHKRVLVRMTSFQPLTNPHTSSGSAISLSVDRQQSSVEYVATRYRLAFKLKDNHLYVHFSSPFQSVHTPRVRPHRSPSLLRNHSARHMLEWIVANVVALRDKTFAGPSLDRRGIYSAALILSMCWER